MQSFLDFIGNSAPLWMWASFFGCFILFICADLFSHKGHKPVSMGNALMWVGLSFVFVLAYGAFVIYPYFGAEDTMRFGTAYAMEMALSVDNLFAIMAIFAAFGLDQPKVAHLQHRILMWGVMGAVLFRLIFLGTIGFITSLVEFHVPAFTVLGITIPESHINVAFVFFGVLLTYMGLNMFKGGHDEEALDPANHWMTRGLSRMFPVDPTMEHGKFFTKAGVTTLFICLMCIEAIDIVFAFDSIPVVLGVIQNNIFLVFAATISACLCLRSLYFVLANMNGSLWALGPAVAILLCIIGVKMTLGAVGIHTPIAYSLASVVILLGGAIVISLLKPRKAEEVAGIRHRIQIRKRDLTFADDLYA